MVGARGFEPPTTTPPVWCATKLRYAPKQPAILCMISPNVNWQLSIEVIQIKDGHYWQRYTWRMKWLIPLLLASIPSFSVAEYCEWEMENYTIEAPLCGLTGDPARGREVVADSHSGNCLACHLMPIPEEPLHGTIGPPLHALGARMTEASIRAHVVDQHRFNPTSIMPGFYVIAGHINRVADEYWGKPFINAQQVEDIVAYLNTLK